MSNESFKYSSLMRIAAIAFVFVGVWIFSPAPNDRSNGLHQVPAPSDQELVELAGSLVAVELPQFSPLEKAAAQLGKKIFFDPGFSSDGTMSCAFCHQPQRDFTDGRERAVGRKELARNTPSLVNSFGGSWFFWDGRASSLRVQAMGPLEATDEHAFDRGRTVQRVWQLYREDYQALFGPWPSELVSWLNSKPAPSARPQEAELEIEASIADYAISTMDKELQAKYVRQAAEAGKTVQEYFATRFFKAEPVPPSAASSYASLKEPVRKQLNQAFVRIAWTIEQYERGLIALDSPFDRFVKSWSPKSGSELEITEYFRDDFGEQEWRGYGIFVQASCDLCHTGPLFSDQQFHNIGLAQQGSQLDLGRALGLLRAKNDPFNCNEDFALPTDSESCREWPYLRLDNPEMVGGFKTPSLRNLSLTAPYMHDGRFKGLEDVLRHYSQLSSIPAVGHRAEALRPLTLSRTEINELAAFLRSLNSPVTDLSAQP